MTFIEVILTASLVFWAVARACEVWLNVLEKAGAIKERRENND